MSSRGKSNNPWIYVKKDDDGALIPYANYDRECFDDLPRNVILRVNINQQRNAPRHRLYRVVLRQVVKNTDLYVNEDSLHKTLLLGCGVVEPVLTTEGEIIMIPSSTAYNAMKEDTFKVYFDRAMQVIATNIIPGIDIEDLLEESRKEANWREREAAW
jgi:hypothetical protein